MKVVGSLYKNIPELAYRFVAEFYEYLQLHDNTDVCFTIGGAHSKALQNTRSDIDLNFYYMVDLRNLVSLTPKTITLRNDFPYERVDKGGTHAYIYHGKEVEVTTYPMYSIGKHAGKQVLRQVADMNGKVIVDVLKDYTIKDGMGCRYWHKLRRILMYDYNYAAYRMMGYFNGYMTSQLFSHRREKDYHKREKQAWENNDPNPVVKCIIEGVYIGLSGIAFVERKEVYRDFWSLWQRYSDMFTPEEQEFVEMLYRHKVDIEPIKMPVSRLISLSKVYRRSIYEKINEAHHEVKYNGKIPYNISESEREENLTRLNELLREMYSVG